MTRLLMLSAFVSALLTASFAHAAEDVIGISQTKPTSGPSVALDGSFMVPYAMKIPGTEVSFEMVPIPAGTVIIGSPASEVGRAPDEGPTFEVAVEPIWIGKYEITWAEYKEFMGLYHVFKEFELHGIRKVVDDNRADAITAPTKLHEPEMTFEYGERPRQAAVTMTQYAARQYTKWLSLTTGHFYRLPTEAEWEYACRGGSQTAYSFGDDATQLVEFASYGENTEGKGQKDVGLKKPNAFGLYDMHGNVWEWTLDAYSSDGYKAQAGKKLKVLEAVAWPTKQYPRVLRGGGWEDDAEPLRSAARLASPDDDWREYDPNLPLSPWWFTNDPARGVGFRIVRCVALPEDKELRKRVWEIDCEDVAYDVAERLREGRGAEGLVDRNLPAAIEQLKAKP